MQKVIWYKTKYEYYEISNTRLIRSLPRGRKKSITILNPTIGKRGYYEVCIRGNGKRKTVKVHRIIAEAFIPNPDNLPEINHIDTDKLNNKITNLEWCTRKYNSNHAYDKGLFHKIDYSTISNRVKSINNLTGEIRYFKSFREASTELNVNYTSIPRVISGKYKHSNNYRFELVQDVQKLIKEV